MKTDDYILKNVVKLLFLALLFGGQLEPAAGPIKSRHIGCIDPQCDLVSVIKDAYENARFLCDQYYLASPDLLVSEHQHVGNINYQSNGLLDRFIVIFNLGIFPGLISKNSDIRIVYVPSHLYHMLFELFKNSMRAVMEYHCSEDQYPPIQVTVVRGKEDICVKVLFAK